MTDAPKGHSETVRLARATQAVLREAREGGSDSAVDYGDAERLASAVLATEREASADAMRGALKRIVSVGERLCSAIERAENDIGGESIAAVLRDLGPAADHGLAALHPNAGTADSGEPSVPAGTVESALASFGRRIDSGDMGGGKTHAVNGVEWLVIPWKTYEHELNNRFERGKRAATAHPAAKPVEAAASREL